ncbi:phosphotransferase, partial [Streptococcus pyogenes]
MQVSSRTVYRTLSDLMLTLEKDGIELIKDGRKYFLSGDLSILEESQSTDEVSASHRLILTAYQLLTSSTTIINEELQEQFWV